MGTMTAFALASVVTWLVAGAAWDVFPEAIATLIAIVVFVAVFFYTDRFIRDLRN